METPRSKPSPPPPRLTKSSVTKSDGSSPSSVTRLSLDRSPQSANSKPTPDRRTARKSQSRLGKGSELQAQLKQIQEDLKKANEQIAVLKKDKAKALGDLKGFEKLNKEANEKLIEALAAAQESSEIEAVHNEKDISWKKEVESVRSQHALDISALLSTTEELHRVQQELAMTADAKNKALSHAEEATKIAEIQAEKVEVLSSELSQLKALVSSEEQKKATEGDEVVSKLKSEIEMLRGELENVSILENKLKDQEECIEQLHVDLEAAKIVESCANSLAAELKNELEKQVEESNKLKTLLYGPLLGGQKHCKRGINIGLEMLLIYEQVTLQGFISSNRSPRYETRLKPENSTASGISLLPKANLSIAFMFHVHEDFEAKCGLRGDLYGHSILINLPTNAVDVVGHMKLLNGQSFIERTYSLSSMSSLRVLMNRDVQPTQDYLNWLGCNPYIANLVNAEEVTKAETMAVGEIFDYMKHGSAKVNLQL
ncbi:hypothetical protein F2Q68_00040441 [Brassica cretica]|uniref:Uncharacterized protein n=1 Tax=Brassica cretica TaxID=69181 RepID=A0A8S9MBU5_BRACR|nr:hypothetical protein F2Q68_00040441 [Brassica cretica]